MKIAISAETTIDLSKELLTEFDIHTIPFVVYLGEKSAPDGVITPKEIFKYVKQTGVLPKTSAINEYQYDKYFEGLLKDYDYIIHFSLSSGISSACENAKRIAALHDNIHVVDSKSLSSGIGLLAIYAAKLVRKGLSFQEIIEKVEARVPFVQASFVIDTLEYLYKGGRCSGLARISAAVFRIKPQIIVSDGKMAPGKKYRGKITPCVEKYCEDTLQQFNSPDLSVAFVTHTEATEEMRAIAYKALKDRGFKTIYDTTAGATISSHCGPATIGILYINDDLNEDL